ncbi:MAG: DUF1697 domain-containing protein [Betaproteobacteria bacterium]|nr:DUF1697 domain-containing protein [Betaproteobacteria bacterium]
MNAYIALLRGINVGSTRTLPMKDLSKLMQGLGCEEIQTYIQSGNVVFRGSAALAAALPKRLPAAIDMQVGFTPRVLVLSAKDWAKAMAANPYPQADAQRLHLFFLATVPKAPDLDAIKSAKTATEQYVLRERVFYLLTPDGFGVSKLAARAEKWLGVDATARNWRTVAALAEMAGL